MFIKSNVSTTIREKGKTYDIPYQYIGSVPEWVENNWYFKSLLNSGDILTYQKEEAKKDSVLEKGDEKAKELKTHSEKVAEEAKVLDEVVNQATKEAEEKAIEQGLDEVTKKNFIKSEVEKAVSSNKKSSK